MDFEQRLLERLLQGHRLYELIVALFAALTALLVVPLTAVRAAGGDWLHAGFDALVVAAAVFGGLYAWSGRGTNVIGPALALLFVTTVVTGVHWFDPALLVWAFPVTVATFFLLRPGPALLLNALAVAAMAPALPAFGPADAVASLLAALLATNVLALVFAATMIGSRRSFRNLAERDPLTGIGNRRALEPALHDALARRVERNTPVSLIALDIDHFKRINDRHGHAAGDRVLVAVTNLIREAIRAGDDLFRYGGEELVVLAYGAPAGPAVALADAIRVRLAQTPVLDEQTLTLSAGVAEARPDDTVDSWFRRADELLYRAKQAGRDCVRCGDAR